MAEVRLLALGLVITCCACPQEPSFPIAGIIDPPELRGTPRPPPVDDRERWLTVDHRTRLLEKATAAAALVTLEELLAKHPDSPEGYFLRAHCSLCVLERTEYAAVTADLSAAIEKDTVSDTLSKTYALRARAHYMWGQYAKAIDDLVSAIVLAPHGAENIFAEPLVFKDREKVCQWNLSEISKLVQLHPDDHRTLMFRGLYYTSRIGENAPDALAAAERDLRRSARLKPSSVYPQFYLANLLAWASYKMGEGAAQFRRRAILEYTVALRLDPRFSQAYYNRAGLYEEVEEYSKAVSDYSAVISLQPNRERAYRFRGNARKAMGDALGAIEDYTRYIDSLRGRPGLMDVVGLRNGYELRADALAAVPLYSSAISDYSEAIRLELSLAVTSLSLNVFRSLYPEYDNVSDGALRRRVGRQLAFSIRPDDSRRNVLPDDGVDHCAFVELYQKRGDAYLRAGWFRKGVLDWGRSVLRNMESLPAYNRWRTIGPTSDTQVLIDVRTATFSEVGGTFWLKFQQKEGHSVRAYEVECNTRRLRVASAIEYDSRGIVTRSEEKIHTEGWGVVPDSSGEFWVDGMCRRN
ncbi:MAG: tetratricopeptide repeat protein [Bryobacteraceae bacterium]|nr:tetratricopeptide repeat protein [Bryobacteraceae bacterium]